ncbi:MAG: 4'-phosphopantetheinyl transferase superfamily protein [Austwickia sp.]|jgi:4'-phosphopantetheinyl transferase|nr:MAG: 4'-phosphopantetheinyl transferase superfamily protein [Austwickia sp.]
MRADGEPATGVGLWRRDSRLSAPLRFAMRSRKPREPAVAWTAAQVDYVDHPLLDPTERARCERLREPADQARHATGRVLAKVRAAECFGVDPSRLQVVSDGGATAGRPRLYLDGEPSTLHLSIAHSGTVVAVALGEMPCGVDVEQTAALAGALELETAFSADERGRLRMVPPAERPALAARWWTGKEAALKAVGVGMALDAASVAADLPVTRVPALGRVQRVRLVPLPAPTGYSATLAYVLRPGQRFLLPS